MSLVGKARGATKPYFGSIAEINNEMRIRDYLLTGGNHFRWTPWRGHVRTDEEKATLTDAYLHTKKVYLKGCVYGREREELIQKKREREHDIIHGGEGKGKMGKIFR